MYQANEVILRSSSLYFVINSIKSFAEIYG